MLELGERVIRVATELLAIAGQEVSNLLATGWQKKLRTYEVEQYFPINFCNIESKKEGRAKK